MGGRLEQSLLADGFDAHLVLDRPSPQQFQSLDPHSGAVISIGGDGSLRSVVGAMLASTSAASPVLVVPMGTANLMGRHLGVRWARENLPAAVAATLRQRKIVRFDAARANGQLFLLMAGVGLDGQVVHLLDSLRRGPIDITSYVLPTALSLAGYRFPPVSVSVDGQSIANNLPAMVFIGNVKEYGTGLPILTRARPDDGLLDICVMPCRDVRDIAELLLLLTTGEHLQREGVVYLRGKNVTVESTSPVPVQLDGDSAGHTPLRIEVLPAAVPFLQPA
jgi:diacylglycerol kinase family enzyme